MPSSLWRALCLSFLTILAFPHNKAIIFLTEDIDFSDIERLNYPAFSFLKAKGSWGLLSTRRSKLEEIVAGVSAGGYPLIKPSQAVLGYNVDEQVDGVEAGYLFYTRTGIYPPEKGVVQIAIEAIKALNREKKTGAFIGLLGSMIRGLGGYKTAVVGNSDALTPRRLAVLIACDENGVVDYGDVSSQLLRKEPLSVAGKVIDLPKFRTALRKVENASLIVIDSGEMGRFSQYEGFLSPQAQYIWRNDCLKRTSELLGETLKIYEKGDLFIFLSLIGTRKDKPDRLSTVAILNENYRGKLLTSTSTRLKGLITLQDIAPTILSFFNLPSPSSMHGKPIVSTEGNLEELYRLFHSSTLEGISQPILIGIFLVLYFIGFLLAVFRLTDYPLLFSLLFPPSLLFFSLFPPSNLLSSIAFSFLLSLALFLLLWLISSKYSYPLLNSILIFIVFLILVDALSGGELSLHSPLNVYALGGCRFYGVGNEYGGILLASLPFALYSLFKSNIFQIGGVFISALCLLLPFWGANLGVSLSLFLLYFLLLYLRYKRRGLLISFLTFLALVVLMGIIASLSVSHIADFARLLVEDTYQSFLLLNNKLLLNLSIVSETGWKAGMLVLAGLFIFALIRGVRVKRGMSELFSAVLLSLIFAFLINDTGAILILLALVYLLAIFVLEGNWVC